MPVKKLLLLPLSFLSLIAVSASVSAAVITIEPDDYEAGTDLSTISPYVTLQSRSWNPVDGTTVGAVHSTTVGGGGGYAAPTGELTFGRHGWEANGTSGFGMVFNQEVDFVSLLAVSEYPDLTAIWQAYDINGNSIASSDAAGHPYGESYQIDIALEGIWSLVIGGAHGISAIDFDQLAFEIDDVVSVSAVAAVPEPAAMPLLAAGMGMLMLAGASRRRQRQAAMLA